jgi:hypothetical protein
MSLVVAWLVFHDPAFDYRLLVAGSLVPFIIDAPFASPAFGHTLVFAVAVLAAVMLGTRRRRHARRHAIAIPIGMLLALVASGMWTKPHVLWWPAFAFRFPHDPLLPPALVVAVEELAGLVAIAWFTRRFRLADRDRRDEWLRTGRVSLTP